MYPILTEAAFRQSALVPLVVILGRQRVPLPPGGNLCQRLIRHQEQDGGIPCEGVQGVSEKTEDRHPVQGERTGRA